MCCCVLQGDRQGEIRSAISVVVMMQDGTAYMWFKLGRDDGLHQKANWCLTLKGGNSCMLSRVMHVSGL